MKLKDIYSSIVEAGISHDPRGIKGVKAYLKKVRDRYDSLSAAEKSAMAASGSWMHSKNPHAPMFSR